ncbi:MAG: protein kinase [Planctomycetaceae bacterium]|nr:protein kinase [Planctomycetaceae bacterium]
MNLDEQPTGKSGKRKITADASPGNTNSAVTPTGTGPDAGVIGWEDPFLLEEHTDLEKASQPGDPGSRTTVLTQEDQQVLPEGDTELEGTILGRFQLRKVIAQGGMGIIVEARDLELDREVAIKLLRRQHSGKAHLHQQFTNEARITGRLQHPGIVPIYETGTSSDNRPFFAMKLVKGKSMAELLAARKTTQDDLPRLLNIFELVCQTLSYTHACGVIHLDIKPSNIMVGAFGEVHLMDWGLARASTELCKPVSEKLSETPALPQAENIDSRTGIAAHDLFVDLPDGAVWGTPAYMSPEQARGHCSDVRSDVFGLGGMLCEILTGSPPYRGANFRNVCLKAIEADLRETYAALVNSGADGVLVRLAIKCLSRDPDARPADAGIVAGELTLYLESLLQRAGSDLERFFELSLDLFCIAGLDGYFRRVNSNFSRVLGYEEKVLLSRPFMDFVHPEDRAQTADVMSRLLRGQPVVQFQNRYAAADGNWRWFEWTAKSVPEDRIIFAVARDVTDRPR